MARTLPDSNSFLYAMATEHAEKPPCQRLLEMVADGRIEAVTSSEVLQEVLYVRLRRGLRSEAVIAVRSIQEIVDEILPVTGEDVLAACEMLSLYPALDSRDAVHAAVARRNRITDIASVDREFDNIKGLRRLSPAQAAA